MSVKLIGSEPNDLVPNTFKAYLDAMSAEIIISVPAYMQIPSIEGEQVEELFNTCAGVLIAPLKDLIEDYANDCMYEDAGDGLLYMASYFEQAAKQLRDFYKTLDPADIIAAKKPAKLVFPSDSTPVDIEKLSNI